MSVLDLFTTPDATVALGVVPGALAALAFAAGSIRRTDRWWLSGPARAERRVDPRCGRFAWTRIYAYAVLLLAPAAVLGLYLVPVGIGVLMLGGAVASIAVARGVVHDSARMSRWAPVPLATSGAVALGLAYLVWSLAAGDRAAALVVGIAAVIHVAGLALSGWQVLIALRAQDGARRIARAAVRADGELNLI